MGERTQGAFCRQGKLRHEEMTCSQLCREVWHRSGMVMLLLLSLTPASVPGLGSPCVRLAAVPRSESSFHSVLGGCKCGRDFPCSRKWLFTSHGLNHVLQSSAGLASPRGRVETMGCKVHRRIWESGVTSHPGHTPLGKENNTKRKLGDMSQPREKNTNHPARLAISAKISSRGNDTLRCHGSLLKLDFSFSFSILTLCRGCNCPIGLMRRDWCKGKVMLC